MNKLVMAAGSLAFTFVATVGMGQVRVAENPTELTRTAKLRHALYHQGIAGSWTREFDGEIRIVPKPCPLDMLREGVADRRVPLAIDWALPEMRPRLDGTPGMRQAVAHRVGTYAVAIIVSKSNEVRRMTRRQVGRVFQNGIRRWRQLPASGRVDRIQVYGELIEGPAGTVIKYGWSATEILIQRL